MQLNILKGNYEKPTSKIVNGKKTEGFLPPYQIRNKTRIVAFLISIQLHMKFLAREIRKDKKAIKLERSKIMFILIRYGLK